MCIKKVLLLIPLNNNATNDNIAAKNICVVEISSSFKLLLIKYLLSNNKNIKNIKINIKFSILRIKLNVAVLPFVSSENST